MTLLVVENGDPYRLAWKTCRRSRMEKLAASRALCECAYLNRYHGLCYTHILCSAWFYILNVEIGDAGSGFLGNKSVSELVDDWTQGFLPLSLKALSHMLHWNGRFFSCTLRMCLFKSPVFFVQYSHVGHCLCFADDETVTWALDSDLEGRAKLE